MKTFAESGGVRADYREVRHLSILIEPIETRGILYFAPPDLLARHTTSPARSSTVIRSGRIILQDEAGRREIEIEASEIARALVSNLMVVLRGDLDALQRRYTHRYESTPDGWSLELEPRSRSVRGIIRVIRFTGQNGLLVSMESHEANGDRIVTTFSEVETGLNWGAKELEQIFSASPPQPMP